MKSQVTPGEKYWVSFSSKKDNPFLNEDDKWTFIVEVLDVKFSKVSNEDWVKYRYVSEGKYSHHKRMFIYNDEGKEVPQEIFEEKVSSFLKIFPNKF